MSRKILILAALCALTSSFALTQPVDDPLDKAMQKAEEIVKKEAPKKQAFDPKSLNGKILKIAILDRAGNKYLEGKLKLTPGSASKAAYLAEMISKAPRPRNYDLLLEIKDGKVVQFTMTGKENKNDGYSLRFSSFNVDWEDVKRKIIHLDHESEPETPPHVDLVSIMLHEEK